MVKAGVGGEEDDERLGGAAGEGFKLEIATTSKSGFGFGLFAGDCLVFS